MQIKIKLRSPEDINIFSKIVNHCPFDVDIISKRTYIDAKSVLGLYSINLNEAFTLDIHAEDDECAELIANLIDYIE